MFKRIAYRRKEIVVRSQESADRSQEAFRGDLTSLTRVSSALSARAFLVFFSILILSGPSHAEMTYETAEEQAQASHDRAASDMIYQQEDTKALYYQNLQIIHLLTDIREEMRKLNSRDK